MHFARARVLVTGHDEHHGRVAYELTSRTLENQVEALEHGERLEMGLCHGVFRRAEVLQSVSTIAPDLVGNRQAATARLVPLDRLVNRGTGLTFQGGAGVGVDVPGYYGGTCRRRKLSTAPTRSSRATGAFVPEALIACDVPSAASLRTSGLGGAAVGIH